MIDRSPSQLHFCLRRRSFVAAALISVGAFLTLPLISLVCMLAGGLAYAGCVLSMLLLICVGGALAIGGAIALLAGIAGNQPEATSGGAVSGIVGLVGLGLFANWNEPVIAAGEAAWAMGTQAAEFMTTQIFLGHYVYLWSWSAAAMMTFAALLVLGLIGVLRCESLVKARLFRIRFACPACHIHATPQYRCPQCSTLASDLFPSPYGIFRARCATCREGLPTLDILGRQRLRKVCRNADCSADLLHPSAGKLRDIHIVVVGAQSSGKSTLMTIGCWELVNWLSSANGFQIEFSSNHEKKALADQIKALAARSPLPKTPSMHHPRAFNLALRSPAGAGCLLYLYDAAGEDLTRESKMSGHGFHRFVDGVVLVVDPFAEMVARGLPIDRSSRTIANPALADAPSVMQPFISRLEQQLNLSAKSAFPIPIAVVVTKLRAVPNVSWSKLVKDRPRGAVANGPRQCTHKTAAVGANSRYSVRQLLLDLGLANLVLGLEARFRKVRYFATSAAEELGSAHRRRLSPLSAKPFLWLARENRALPVLPPSGRAPAGQPPSERQKD